MYSIHVLIQLCSQELDTLIKDGIYPSESLEPCLYRSLERVRNFLHCIDLDLQHSDFSYKYDV